MHRATTSSWPKDNILVQVSEQNSFFPLGGHYACQCVLFLVLFEFVIQLLLGQLYQSKIAGL